MSDLTGRAANTRPETTDTHRNTQPRKEEL